MRKALFVGVAGMAALLALGQAQAQTAPAAAAPAGANAAGATKVETLIVTAERRAEDLQVVPTAVTGFSDKYISEMGLTTAKDFALLLPNTIFEDGSFSIDQHITIRGVGPGQDLSEPGFGYYRDGQYMGGLRINFSDFMDLERVEVLRGPQGGLYGRDAVGGAINFIYKQPDLNDTSGQIQVGYGNLDRLETRGIVNIPIVDGKLAARFDAWNIDQAHGQFYNSFLHEYVDTYHSSGGRASLKWQATDDVSVVWQLERSHQSGPEVSGVQPYEGETFSTIQADTPSTATKDFTFASQAINWNTGDLGVVTLLASYREYQLNSLADQDAGTDPTNHQEIARHENESAEYVDLQWASPSGQRFTWVAGANYFHESFHLFRPVTCIGVNCSPPISLFQATFSQPTDSVAVFGQATFNITNTLSVTGNARYSRDTKSLVDNLLIEDLTGATLLNNTANTSAVFPSTVFGGDISWRPTDDLNFYARVQQGFRAGGYNTGISQPNFDPTKLPFGPENSINYEIGAKTKWWNDRLVLNGALFRLDQSHLQGLEFDKFFNFFNANIGESTTYGAELEATVKPTDKLLVTGGYGWISGKLTGGVSTVVGPLAGTLINFGNGQNWNLNAIYTEPLAPDTNLTFQISWIDQRPVYPANFFFIGDTSGAGNFNGSTSNYMTYSLINASVSISKGRWTVRAYGSNLTNDHYIVSEAFFSPFGPGTLFSYGDPRRFGAEVTVNF